MPLSIPRSCSGFRFGFAAVLLVAVLVMKSSEGVPARNPVYAEPRT